MNFDWKSQGVFLKDKMGVKCRKIKQIGDTLFLLQLTLFLCRFEKVNYYALINYALKCCIREKNLKITSTGRS